jgi:hypothetical protein
MKLKTGSTATAMMHHNHHHHHLVVDSSESIYHRLNGGHSAGRITKPSAADPSAGVVNSRLAAELSESAAAAAGVLQEQAMMAACFSRLRELVPAAAALGVRSAGPCSDPSSDDHQVDLLQHVIDYILDLENSLEELPPVTSESSSSEEDAGSTCSDVFSASSTSRNAEERRLSGSWTLSGNVITVAQSSHDLHHS